MSRRDRDHVMGFIRRVVPWEALRLPRWRLPRPGFTHSGTDGARHIGKNTQWYQRWESIIRLDYARKARGDDRSWEPTLERFNIAQASEPWRDALRRLQRHAFPGSERFPDWYDPAQRKDARHWGVLTVRLDAMLDALGIAEVRRVLRGCDCDRCDPPKPGRGLADRLAPAMDRVMAARRQISSGRRFGKTLELDQAIRDHLREGRTVAVATPDGTVGGEEYLQTRERTDP